jgi:hypothetical protein
MADGISPPNISRQNRTSSSFPWPSVQSSPSPAPNHPSYSLIACFTLSSANISYNNLSCSHLIPRDNNGSPISLSCISKTPTYQNCKFHLMWKIRHHDHMLEPRTSQQWLISAHTQTPNAVGDQFPFTGLYNIIYILKLSLYMEIVSVPVPVPAPSPKAPEEQSNSHAYPSIVIYPYMSHFVTSLKDQPKLHKSIAIRSSHPPIKHSSLIGPHISTASAHDSHPTP